MKMSLVGSSIHDALLSPSDRDIFIETHSLSEFKSIVNNLKGNAKVNETVDDNNQGVAVFRQGDLNFIVGLNITTQEYTSGMDVNLVRGYQPIESSENVLTEEAKQGLLTKTIEFLPRNQTHQNLFSKYGYEQQRSINRHEKYAKKLPPGWRLIIDLRGPQL